MLKQEGRMITEITEKKENEATVLILLDPFFTKLPPKKFVVLSSVEFLRKNVYFFMDNTYVKCMKLKLFKQ